MAANTPMLTPDEFKQKAVDYIADCKARDEKLTLTGLALALGFCSKQSIYDYKKRDEYSDIVKWATLNVEHQYEKRLLEDGSPTGAIFALKSFEGGAWGSEPERKVEDPSEALSKAIEALADKLPGA